MRRILILFSACLLLASCSNNTVEINGEMVASEELLEKMSEVEEQLKELEQEVINRTKEFQSKTSELERIHEQISIMLQEQEEVESEEQEEEASEPTNSVVEQDNENSSLKLGPGEYEVGKDLEVGNYRFNTFDEPVKVYFWNSDGTFRISQFIEYDYLGAGTWATYLTEGEKITVEGTVVLTLENFEE